MAVTAKFTADFASFNQAVTKAEVTLKTFSSGAASVEKSLNRMANSLTGTKLIQDATLMAQAVEKIGGPSKLTQQELDRVGKQADEAAAKMRKLGIEVPASFSKIQEASRDVAQENEKMWTKLQSGLQTFSSGAKTIGLGLTAAITAPILAVGAAVVKFGVEAVESENLVSVSFGEMRGAADDWSKDLSKNLGLNEFEMRKQAATIFNMTTSMGLNKTAAFDMSTGMVKLAADMASFRNIPMEEAFQKIQSGLTGEAEPLKRIGILVDDATIKTEAYRVGIARQGEELTGVQKVQARWSAILRQTTNDQGDLARTMDSPTNQFRRMKNEITEAATALGIQLLPYITKAVSSLSSIVPYIQSTVEWFGKLPEPLKLTAIGITAVFAATGPTVYILGQLAGAAANLVPLVQTLAGAQGFANLSRAITAFASGPGLVLAGIFVGAGIAIYNLHKDINDLEAHLNRLREGQKAQPIPGIKDVAGNLLVAADAAQKAADALPPAAAAANLTAEGFSFMGKALKTVTTGPGLGEFEKQIKDAKKVIADLDPAVRRDLVLAIRSGVAELSTLKNSFGGNELAAKLFKEQVEKTATSGKKFAEVQRELTDLFEGQNWDGTIDDALRLGATVGQLAVFFGKSEGEIKKHQIAIEKQKKALEDDKKEWEAIEKSINESRAALEGVTKATEVNTTQLGLAILAKKRWIDLNKVPVTLPDVKPSGKVDDAYKGIINLTGKLRNSLQGVSGVLDGINNKFAQVASVATRAIDGIIANSGNLIAQISIGVSAAISAIATLFTNAEKAINPTRKAFVDAAGGLDALRDKATNAGVSINALLNAKNAKQYEAAIKDLNEAFAATEQQLEAIDEIQSLIVESGAALTGNMAAALQELMTIPGLSNSAKDALLALTEDTQPNFEQLTKMAKEYGIELSMLGPQFQQADITRISTQLISDFEKLRDAGADVGGVINGMSDEINKVVKDALAFGTTIPENMRFMIEALINSNQLFDEQGKLITDIGRLKFGDAVETEADKIVKAIKELGEILKGLPTIANQAARGITQELSGVRAPDIRQRVTYDYDRFQQPEFHQGGVVMHAGGVVDRLASNVLPFRGLRAHSGLAIGEVPIIAQRGEGILSRRDMTALGGVGGFNALRRSLQGGGSQTVNVSTTALESEVRGLRQDLPKALARAVRDELQKVTTGRR